MKKFFTFFILLFLMETVHAQNITQYIQILPPGYTSAQARLMNDFKVLNDSIFWIGFQLIGLGRYDGVTWNVYNPSNSSMPSNQVNAVETDGSIIWAGTAAGLVKFDGLNFTVYNTFNSGITGNYVLSLKKKGSDLWIGTRQGVSKFDGATFINYTTGNSGLANDTVNTIVTRTNEVWFCSNNGLSRFANNIWTTWNFPFNQITNAVFDFNGDVWALSGNVYKLNPSSGIVADFANEVFPDYYNEQLPLTFPRYCITADASGQVYFVFNPPNAFNYATFGKYDLSGIKHFYTDDNNQQGFKIFNGQGTRLIPLSGNRMLVAPRLASTNLVGILDYLAQPPFLNFHPNALENNRHLDRNNVKARILSRGDMHWNLYSATYEVPKGSSKHSVFSSALWIGGIDENGELRTAAQTYRQQAGLDFYPGPIEGLNIPFDSVSCQQYDRIWKINKEKVDEFITNYQNGNVSNGTYKINNDFLTWPATGNGAVTGSLAPFHDYNLDGTYNPYDGDYPLITGDQMLYWMFNDSLGPHTETESKPIGIDIQAKAYVLNRPGNSFLDSVLHHTTFYHYRIANRSIHNYDSVYIGLWCDVDLGKYDDDMIACDSTLNAGFGFNGDNDDEGADGYGLNPPMQNLQVLSGPLPYPNDGIDNNNNGQMDEPGEECRMTNFMHYVNDFNPVNGNPVTKYHYYNYMKTLNRDSTAVVGIGGYDTKFVLNGQPYSSNFPLPSTWIPTDQRFLIGSGPFRLHAGEETCIEFAYIFTRNTSASNGLNTSIATNIAALQAVESFYRDSLHASCYNFPLLVNDQQKQNFTLHAYPNPVTGILKLNLSDFVEPVHYLINDLTGRNTMTGVYSPAGINVSRLQQGFYLLKAKTGNEWKSVKFVKM